MTIWRRRVEVESKLPTSKPRRMMTFRFRLAPIGVKLESNRISNCSQTGVLFRAEGASNKSPFHYESGRGKGVLAVYASTTFLGRLTLLPDML